MFFGLKKNSYEINNSQDSDAACFLTNNTVIPTKPQTFHLTRNKLSQYKKPTLV